MLHLCLSAGWHSWYCVASRTGPQTQSFQESLQHIVLAVLLAACRQPGRPAFDNPSWCSFITWSVRAFCHLRATLGHLFLHTADRSLASPISPSSSPTRLPDCPAVVPGGCHRLVALPGNAAEVVGSPSGVVQFPVRAVSGHPGGQGRSRSRCQWPAPHLLSSHSG